MVHQLIPHPTVFAVRMRPISGSTDKPIIRGVTSRIVFIGRNQYNREMENCSMIPYDMKISQTLSAICRQHCCLRELPEEGRTGSGLLF